MHDPSLPGFPDMNSFQEPKEEGEKDVDIYENSAVVLHACTRAFLRPNLHLTALF